MSKKTGDLNGLTIEVVVLKNKKTGEVKQMLPVSYVAQQHKFPQQKWEISVKKQKISMFETPDEPLK